MRGSSSKKKRNQQNGQFSALTQKKLIEFLMKTAQLERKLEIIKEMLAQEPDFTPASLFHRLDQQRKKYINERNIQDFLIKANIPYKGSELKTLFGRIDVNQNQKISLRQFQDFILPNQNPKLRYQTVRRPVVIPLPGQKLSQQIQFLTSKFFNEIISQYTRLMDFNNSLISTFDFNVEQLFDLLSSDKQSIRASDIQKFLQKNNKKITSQELGCIIKLIDMKGQGRIHLDDFKTYLATLHLKKPHQILDQLSPIPTFKNSGNDDVNRSNKSVKDRDKTLKQRYKDNKSYVKGMDPQGHHILGYSRVLDPIFKNNQHGIGINDSRRSQQKY